MVHTINSSNPEGEVGGPLWGQHDLHSMIQASQRFIERNSQKKKKNWGVTAPRWENQEFKDSSTTQQGKTSTSLSQKPKKEK